MTMRVRFLTNPQIAVNRAKDLRSVYLGYLLLRPLRRWLQNPPLGSTSNASEKTAATTMRSPALVIVSATPMTSARSLEHRASDRSFNRAPAAGKSADAMARGRKPLRLTPAPVER
jgi:hypothetical protein